MYQISIFGMPAPNYNDINSSNDINNIVDQSKRGDCPLISFFEYLPPFDFTCNEQFTRYQNSTSIRTYFLWSYNDVNSPVFSDKEATTFSSVATKTTSRWRAFLSKTENFTEPINSSFLKKQIKIILYRCCYYWVLTNRVTPLQLNDVHEHDHSHQGAFQPYN